MTGSIIHFLDEAASIYQTAKLMTVYTNYQLMLEERSTIANSNSLDVPVMNQEPHTIQFHHVTFRYPNTKRDVLKDINFTINKHDKIGLVGLNGSGKTTLIHLLSRLYDPTEGMITMNGIDIKTIPYQLYSEKLAIVLQDFFLFAYSIEENICFDQVIDNERLAFSIEKSGLTSKIDALEKGLKTSVYKELDDEGIEFSGGEGQKLAMARALYKNSDLLILDEPTSALDPIEEFNFFNRLSAIQNKTKLFISHRLSSTKFCDTIIVLDKGEIIEMGTHHELMALGGTYADLFQSQAEFYQMRGASFNEKSTQ